jgi:small conductance mechanosensitive channel
MKRIVIPAICALLALATSSLAQDEPKPAEGAPEIDSSLQLELSAEHTVEELQLLVTPLTLEQLTSEADRWQALIQDQMARVANLKVAAMRAEGEEADRLHEQINEAVKKRTELIDKARMIVTSMELKGAKPEVTDAYRDFVTGALASELQATDLKTTLAEVMDWAVSSEGGLGFLRKAVLAVAAFFLLYLAARLISALFARGIRRLPHVSKLMQDFLLKIIFWLALITGLLIVLSFAGVNITPLFAVLGGASFILAFAMQETLGNLASGIMIMANRPFDVGDLIDTNGVLGKVEAVSIVSTTVRTVDNQVVILPNSTVWSNIITNVTVSPIRRVDMVFGIGYGDDIETAMDVLKKLVADHPLILEDPEPNIQVHELADSSVNFICRPWAKTEDYWNVYWDMTRQVKEGFDAAGVSIPFPQRDVHLYTEA